MALGGLKDELQNKRLHAFAKGTKHWYGEVPDMEQLEKDGWVFGEPRSQLLFEIAEEGESCEITITG